MLLNQLRCETTIDEMRNKTDYEKKFYDGGFLAWLIPNQHLLFNSSRGYIFPRIIESQAGSFVEGKTRFPQNSS
jgi:hypothetical protein